MPSSASLDAIDQKLAELVPLVQPTPRTGPGRPEVLPATLLWSGVVSCVLAGSTHQTAIWRLLSQHGLWDYPRIPISAEGVRQRLLRLGPATMAQWFADITTVLDQQYPDVLSLAPFATGVFVIDESTLDKVARKVPALRDVPDGDRRLLPGKLQTVFNVRTQRFHHVQTTANPLQNEKISARDLLATIPEGSLVLTDLGYFGFKWFDDLTDGNYTYVSRLRQGTTVQDVQVLARGNGVEDALVWLGKYRADRAKHLVRRITITTNRVTRHYLTNILDPRQLSVRDVVELYGRRWTVEQAFSTIKTELGLHLVWSARWELTVIQVYGVLIVAQIAMAIRGEIARRGGHDVFEVSIKLLLRDLTMILRHLQPGRDLIDHLASLPKTKHGYIRPSRMTVFAVPDPGRYTLPPPDLVTSRTPRYGSQAYEATRQTKP